MKKKRRTTVFVLLLFSFSQSILWFSNSSLSQFSLSQHSSFSHLQPYFILHVGPPKTATTTLQCGLCRLNLTQDGYQYLGKPCGDCVGKAFLKAHGLFYELSQQQQQEGPVLQELRRRLKYYHRLYQSVIVSAENLWQLGDQGVKRLKLLLQDQWRVVVVISYRRYFEHLVSLYYQQHAKNKTASLVEYLAGHVPNATHPTLTAWQTFAPHVSVVLFPLQGNVVSNFVCQILPTAVHACHDLKRHNYSSSTLRVSNALTFDAAKLAQAIRRKFPNRTVRDDVATRMLEKAWKNNYTAFLSCFPTPHRLLNLSTHFEQQLMKRTNLNLSSTVQKDFEVALQRNKFCELDTHKLLTHPNAATFRKLWNVH
jgi:hypothetical protein